MSETVKRYMLSLCLSDGKITIGTKKFELKDLDTFTMKFEDDAELLKGVIANHNKFGISTSELEYLKLVQHNDETHGEPYSFEVEHEYKGGRYQHVLYAKDYDDNYNFQSVRAQVVRLYKYRADYNWEVLFTERNKALLDKFNISYQFILNHLQHVDGNITDEKIKHAIDGIHRVIYYELKNKDKVIYREARYGYISTMEYIKNHNLLGKIPNTFGCKQLEPKPKPVLFEESDTGQLQLKLSYYQR